MDRMRVEFEDLKEGAAGPDWSVENLQRVHFVKYAGASGDFNPMHYDETLAKSVGYRSVFGQGMFTAGVLSHYLTDWLGIGSLRRFKVRFRTQLWPGDTISMQAKVARAYREDGEERVDVEANVLNQKGDVLIEGWATAAPPSRG